MTKNGEHLSKKHCLLYVGIPIQKCHQNHILSVQNHVQLIVNLFHYEHLRDVIKLFISTIFIKFKG